MSATTLKREEVSIRRTFDVTFDPHEVRRTVERGYGYRSVAKVEETTHLTVTWTWNGEEWNYGATRYFRDVLKDGGLGAVERVDHYVRPYYIPRHGEPLKVVPGWEWLAEIVERLKPATVITLTEEALA